MYMYLYMYMYTVCTVCVCTVICTCISWPTLLHNWSLSWQCTSLRARRRAPVDIYVYIYIHLYIYRDGGRKWREKTVANAVVGNEKRWEKLVGNRPLASTLRCLFRHSCTDRQSMSWPHAIHAIAVG